MESRRASRRKSVVARSHSYCSNAVPGTSPGPLLGLVLVGFRAALNKPFGALGGFVDVVEKKPRWSRLGVSGFVLIGTVVGGALYAGLTGTFHPTFSYGGEPPPKGQVAIVRHDRGLAASPPVGYMLKVEGVCSPPSFLCLP